MTTRGDVTLFEPMLAVDGDEPFDDPLWLFEPKWDGYRALVAGTPAGVVIHGRRQALTAFFPELGTLPVPNGTILDGEIIAFDRDGRPDFYALHQKPRTVAFVAFDLLSREGMSLLERPLRERHARLRDDLARSDRLFIVDGVVGLGRSFYQQLLQRSFEGMMAKHLGSKYVPGQRSPYWKKFVHRRETTVEIPEFLESEGHVLLAQVYDGGLYRGKVVVPERLLDPSVLRGSRVTRAGSGYRLDPPLMARVRYRSLTPTGHFRHAAFISFVP
jgi:bifunctional non-homologous end joining protein LigD